MTGVAASWVVGTVLLSWICYLVGYATRGTEQPLLWGNLSAGAVGIALWLIGVYRVRPALTDEPGSRRLGRAMLVPAIIAGIFAWLCFRVLNVTDDGLVRAGPSVFSDYGPHLAVMRSFSKGHNFPTEYPHFPDGNARYHFMFQFLCGNLEWLGLPLDWAFNLPSIAAFTAAVFLLFALAVRITGSGLAGALAVVLFFFRSALAAWHFVRESSSLPDFFQRAWANEHFIGVTRHEDWGLWNQNVYLNQRHLCLGLAVLFLVLLLVYPSVEHMAARCREPGADVRGRLQLFFISREGWLPEGVRGLIGRGLGIGLLVGASGFWNGAAVIAILLILCIVAIVSAYRLEYLVIAGVAVALSFLQNCHFIGADSLAVAPEWIFGFLAEPPATPAAVARYFHEILGLLPWVLVGGLVWTWTYGRRSQRLSAGMRIPGRLALAFVAPIVLAVTITLTPDVAINHKYVMIAVILLNILVAGWLALMFRSGPLFQVLAVLLTFALTVTGWIDLRTITNKNRPETAVVADLNEPVLKWVLANTDRNDRLLTDWYSFHPILLSGRTIYYGWPYYAWSAGYDIHGREQVVKRIYGGTDPEDVRRAVSEARVQYIVIDDGNRQQKLYTLQEALLTSLFPVVYRDEDVVVLQTNPPSPSR